MYSNRSFDGQAANTRHDPCPPPFRRLFRRERELAMIVYKCGLATANDVTARLDEPLTNPAVRSMLNRLVRKGILTRQMLARERAFIYASAFTAQSCRQAALEQFADDFYEGSVADLAEAVADLLVLQRYANGREMRQSTSTNLSIVRSVA